MSPPKSIESPGRSAERAARGAGRAIARLSKHLEHGLAPVDLSLPQYRVLALLAGGPAASSWLADRLTVSPPSVTAVVDGLVAHDLVVRIPDPSDRRRLNLELTEAGRRILVAADDSVNERLTQIAAHLADEEAAAAIDDLEAWHDALDAYRDERRREADSEVEVTMTMTSPGKAKQADRTAFGTDFSSPFVPVGVTPRYPAPRANIKPDQGGSWLKRALPVLFAHKKIFVISLVASFVGLGVQVLIPAVVAEAIDKGLKHNGDLTMYVGLIVVLACVRFVLNYTSRLFMLKTAYRVEYDLRNIMYEHLSRMSFSFYDRVQSGELISRGNSDIRQVQMYLAMAPIVFVQCSVAILAFILMLTINVPLAFVAMSTMPFVFIVAIRMRRYMFPVSWLAQARLADVATVVDENINGVRVVKSFAAEEQQLRKLTKAARRTEWANVKDADIRAHWAPLIENLPRLGQALVLLYGGYLAIHGQATVGDIVAFNAYVLMLQPPFRQLGMVMMMGQRAAASAGRIFEVLDEQPTVVDRPGAVDMVECVGDVHFDHVTFDYANGTHVLKGFDLHLQPGETVAIVGRTGTGKSTVARLLARFYDVTGGAVRVDGRDIRDVTLPSLRHHIGMVLDEPFLFSVSIRDNIAYGRPDAPIDDVVAAAKAAGADGFIRAMPEGYDTVVGERGFTLSGGQRQRIAIARTLVVNPPILVLDDATSAIDVQIEQQIHAALSDLMENRTTLIIAHRLSTISLADRVAVVEDGRVIAQGTHTELLEREPRYAEILAQTEEDATRRAEEREAARAEHERNDERLIARAVDADVASSRDLDADVGESADFDPELDPRLAPRGGMD